MSDALETARREQIVIGTSSGKYEAIAPAFLDTQFHLRLGSVSVADPILFHVMGQ